MDKKNKKISLGTIIASVVVIFLAYFIFMAVGIYFFRAKDSALGKKTAEVFPYPSVFIGKKTIRLSLMSERLAAVKQFYESQDFSKLNLRIDFSTPDGRKRLKIKEKNILEKLIEDAVVEQEAKKRGIKLTAEIIDQEVDRKLKEYGTGSALNENLKNLYGWGLDDFKKNIVEPDLYKEKLFADIKENDSSYSGAKNKIGEAALQLQKKELFEAVAKKYSEGESAKKGGDLGWFSADQMMPEIALEVFKLEKGKISPTIESPIGFHIIKLKDKKTENGAEMFDLSQIYIKTKSFSEWITEMEKKRKIFIPLDEFWWNKNEARVEFKDEEMKKFEQEIINNPSEDASILF